MSETRPEFVEGLARYRRDPPVRGPRVVLVHGSMDRASAFLRTTRRLRDLDLVRYDRRGYGRSTGAAAGADLAEQVDDLCTVLDGEPAFVVGHSLGAVIALVAAARHPDLVVAVGAYEPPMPWEPWWPARSAGGEARAAASGADPAAAAETFMRRVIGDAHWERLPTRTRRQRLAEGPALLADLASIRVEPPPFDAATLEVPLVVGYGTASHERHQRAAQVLASAVPGSVLVAVDGAEHVVHLGHPDEFAAFVRRVVAA